MKNLLVALTVMALAVGSAMAGTLKTTLYHGVKVVKGEVLVLFDESLQPGDLQDMATQEGLTLTRVRLDNGVAVSGAQWVASADATRPTRVVVMSFDPATRTLDDVIARLQAQPGIVAAEPNHIAQAYWTPNDPLYNQQYGLTKVGCPVAWDTQRGQTSVIVSITDTGVDTTHPDFNTHYRADLGYDFINNDNDPYDDHGHGTHVSGTVAEATDNSIGGAGIAPGVSIMATKVLDASGSGSYEAVAAGIDWSRTHGANIINMSLGGSSSNATLEAAVNAARDAGVFIAAASGNNGGAIGYPAKYDACVAVGATDSNNQRASFSNYGAELDIAAPGVGVLSMVGAGNHGYQSWDGTSMATPHVAGAAALVFSKATTGTTGAAVRTILQNTAQDLGAAGWDQFFGWGLVRADRALAATP